MDSSSWHSKHFCAISATCWHKSISGECDTLPSFLFEKTGKARKVNLRFGAMMSHYLLEPDFCNRAAGWEKGRVEKAVQDGRSPIFS